jgi:hypothetical protein
MIRHQMCITLHHRPGLPSPQALQLMRRRPRMALCHVAQVCRRSCQRKCLSRRRCGSDSAAQHQSGGVRVAAMCRQATPRPRRRGQIG